MKENQRPNEDDRDMENAGESTVSGDKAPEPAVNPELLAREQERARYREERARSMPHQSRRRMPRSRVGRAFFRMRRFLARKRRALLIALVVALSGIVLLITMLVISYYTINQSIGSGNSTDTYVIPGDDGREKVLIIPFTEAVNIVDPMLQAYADKDSSQSVLAIMSAHKKHNTRADADRPVELSYSVENLTSTRKIKTVRFVVSEYEDYSMPRVIYADNAREGKVSVSHLKTGTRYFYKVIVTLNDDTTLEAESFFETAVAPRFVSILNTNNNYLYNIRDLGGWMTVESSEGNQSIRQGMIFRGCELDGYHDIDCVISPEEGVSDMLAVLGIRTELDLRGENSVPGFCALGYNVNHFRVNCLPYYNDKSTVAQREAVQTGIRRVFEILADENNYPIYIHDAYGCEEAGMICYLLEAVLGVSDAELKKDYDMSGFSQQAVSAPTYTGFTQMIRVYGIGKTTQEKVMDFLTDTCGVPAGDLLHIREILLEDAGE